MNTERTKHPCETVDASADVMKLAGMILSDCGCSTAISDSLQRRVAGRIQLHMDSVAQQLELERGSLFAESQRKQQLQGQVDALMEAMAKISGMTMSMYTSAGEAMRDAKRIAHEAMAAAEQAQQAEPVNKQLLDALKELVSIVEIHSEAIDYNFAWAELSCARQAIAAAEQAQQADHFVEATEMAQQAEPVAWMMFDRHGTRTGWTSEKEYTRHAFRSVPLYAQPPAVAVAVAVPDERAAFEVWLQENIDDTDTVRPSKEKVDAYFAVWLARAMLAAAPQDATEGCGACGDGCQGQGCRLELESPPTCQKCNGAGVIRGLLSNGGGSYAEPCPDCTAPQATAEDSSVVQDAVAVPVAAQMREALEMMFGSNPSHSVCHHEGADIFGRVKGTWSLAAETACRAALAAAPQAVATGWIDPNDKTQKQFLPHIGEPVLFCCDGVTYYGVHTGGSFETANGFAVKFFETWDCLWMYPPAAAQKGGA